MLWCMQRTNIYLTEDQQRALDVRARMAGTNRSAVLREILDDELAQPATPDEQLRAPFAALADPHAQPVARLFDDDPALTIDARSSSTSTFPPPPPPVADPASAT